MTTVVSTEGPPIPIYLHAYWQEVAGIVCLQAFIFKDVAATEYIIQKELGLRKAPPRIVRSALSTTSESVFRAILKEVDYREVGFTLSVDDVDRFGLKVLLRRKVDQVIARMCSLSGLSPAMVIVYISHCYMPRSSLYKVERKASPLYYLIRASASYKVERYFLDLHKIYPSYNFNKNQGYLSIDHLVSIINNGMVVGVHLKQPMLRLAKHIHNYAKSQESRIIPYLNFLEDGVGPKWWYRVFPNKRFLDSINKRERSEIPALIRALRVVTPPIKVFAEELAPIRYVRDDKELGW